MAAKDRDLISPRNPRLTVEALEGRALPSAGLGGLLPVGLIDPQTGAVGISSAPPGSGPGSDDGGSDPAYIYRFRYGYRYGNGHAIGWYRATYTEFDTGDGGGTGSAGPRSADVLAIPPAIDVDGDRSASTLDASEGPGKHDAAPETAAPVAEPPPAPEAGVPEQPVAQFAFAPASGPDLPKGHWFETELGSPWIG